jgi:hypothetical protein
MMAVQVVDGGKNGSGTLGNIGSLLSLAGMFIPGAQGLSALGTAMSAVGGLASGNPAAAIPLIKDIRTAGGVKNWMNPAQNNAFQSGGAQTQAQTSVPQTQAQTSVPSTPYQPNASQASALWNYHMFKALEKQGYWGF